MEIKLTVLVLASNSELQLISSEKKIIFSGIQNFLKLFHDYVKYIQD